MDGIFLRAILETEKQKRKIWERKTELNLMQIELMKVVLSFVGNIFSIFDTCLVIVWQSYWNKAQTYFPLNAKPEQMNKKHM